MNDLDRLQAAIFACARKTGRKPSSGGRSKRHEKEVERRRQGFHMRKGYSSLEFLAWELCGCIPDMGSRIDGRITRWKPSGAPFKLYNPAELTGRDDIRGQVAAVLATLKGLQKLGYFEQFPQQGCWRFTELGEDAFIRRREEKRALDQASTAHAGKKGSSVRRAA